MRSLFTPLLPDDYIELINPLWSTRELRGRVERIERETEDTVTIVIKPGHAWMGHDPGQYLRIGVIIDGVHHWRAYSLTSETGRADGTISVTPKLVEEGTVSPHLVEQLKPGTLIRLGGVEGDFTLPDPLPERFLFISAGSGITPIMSMLRELDRLDEVSDVVLIHSSHTREGVVFVEELEHLESKHDGFRLHLQITGGESGRMKPADLDELCEDWRDRATFASGPGELLDDLIEHWSEEELANPELLFMERFQPRIGTSGEEGEGGSVHFTKSDLDGDSDGSTPILVVGEEAGIEMPFGCREGICHTCLCKLVSGQVRDMRNGDVKGTEGEMIRTCIHAPEGAIELEI